MPQFRLFSSFSDFAYRYDVSKLYNLLLYKDKIIFTLNNDKIHTTRVAHLDRIPLFQLQIGPKWLEA
jgi:hypothetical protein